jgi:hypothetical protein
MTIDYELRLIVFNVSEPLSRFRFSAVYWALDRRKAET